MLKRLGLRKKKGKVKSKKTSKKSSPVTSPPPKERVVGSVKRSTESSQSLPDLVAGTSRTKSSPSSEQHVNSSTHNIPRNESAKSVPDMSNNKIRRSDSAPEIVTSSSQNNNNSRGGPRRLKSSSLRSNLLREQKARDPLFYYETLALLGAGSMGSVMKVKKRDHVVGGSARKDFETFFQQPTRTDEKANSEGDVAAASVPPPPPKAVLTKQESSMDSYSSEVSTSRSNSSARALKTTGTSGTTSKPIYYALKSIHLNRVTDDDFVRELRNEIEILKKLDHPHIVKAIETYEHRNQLFVVLELCSGGDLYSRDPYTEEQVARIVSSILDAVAYMHGHNICHRDLKYENVLFVNDSADSEIKLIDFGLSEKYMETNPVLSERVGTMYTMAPEVLKGSYTSQAELWSIGVMTFMLLSSKMPFYGRNNKEVMEKILQCDYQFIGRRWKKVTQQARTFVSDLLVLNPDERPTAEEACSSAWLHRGRHAATVRAADLDEMNTIEQSIASFVDYSKLKKLALMVIAHKSTSEEIGILRKVFQQYDTEKNGIITLPEFKRALARHGYQDDELETMFHGVNLDGTGKIQYTEFLAATIEAHGAINEERLAEAFDRLDSDDSGYISSDNLRDLLGDDMTPDEIDDIIKEADLKGDGRISYPDFLAQWGNHEEQWRECQMNEILLQQHPPDKKEEEEEEVSTSTTLAASITPQLVVAEQKKEMIEDTCDDDTLARANFLEEKKLSEGRQRVDGEKRRQSDGGGADNDEDLSSNVPSTCSTRC